jgi:hypothetical protein
MPWVRRGSLEDRDAIAGSFEIHQPESRRQVVTGSVFQAYAGPGAGRPPDLVRS